MGHPDAPRPDRNFRLHDLRHTFASRLLAQGVGLEVIGGLLGHTRAETTYRYAHLATGTMRSALERLPAPDAAAGDSLPAGK